MRILRINEKKKKDSEEHIGYVVHLFSYAFSKRLSYCVSAIQEMNQILGTTVPDEILFAFSIYNGNQI